MAYMMKRQVNKLFHVRFVDLKENETRHETLDIDGVKKFLPRDTDLYIMKAVCTRMDINSYVLYRPAHLQFEMEIRRIR